MPQDVVSPEAASTALDASDVYVSSHLRLKRVIDEQMQAAGLSFARTKLLSQLLNGPMRQQALATCFGFAPRSITDMVDALEREGLAERTDDPNDRRAKLVRVTPAGERAVNAAMAVKNEIIHHIFGALSEADRQELVRLIRLLEAGLDTLPDRSVDRSSAPRPG